MATCSSGIETALREAYEEAKQDKRSAERILDQAARNQCNTWDTSTFSPGLANTFEIAQAQFERVVGSTITRVRVHGAKEENVRTNFETSARLIDAERVPDRKTFDSMTGALASHCDGGYKILSRRHESFPYQIVVCESGAPPASHSFTDIGDTVCDGFRTRLVPISTQTFSSPGTDAGVNKYVHTFVCMGKQASTSEDYQTGVQSLLSDLQSLQHEEFKDPSTDLQHACACQSARESATLVCQGIQAYARDFRSAGSTTSSAQYLNLPRDKHMDATLAYLANVDETADHLQCSQYQVGQEAAGCCPPNTQRMDIVDNDYGPCLSLANRTSLLFHDGTHDVPGREQFCKQCERIKEGVHKNHKINFGLFKMPTDWFLTAGKTAGAALATAGLGAIQFFSGKGMISCEDCRLWNHCFDEKNKRLPSYRD